MPQVWCLQHCVVCLHHGCLTVPCGKCLSFDGGLSAKKSRRAATYFQHSKHIVDRTERWPLHSFLHEVCYLFQVLCIPDIIPRICGRIHGRDYFNQYKCVTVYWCFLLLTSAIETYFIFDNDAYDEIVLWSLQNNSNFKIVMQLIYTAFMFHISAMWLGITLIISFVSIFLVREYQIINKEVLQLSHSNFLHRLEHFRRRHYKVGYLTRSFDQFISSHFAIDATCDFTVCSLLLYELIWDQLINDDIGHTMIFTVFIIITIAKVIFEFFCAGILNDAVSKCKIHFSHWTEAGQKYSYAQHVAWYG